jgi:RNase adapter protein RapZ
MTSAHKANGKAPLEVSVTSFGYKKGPAPHANMVFDVRFLKNPFWVEELKPLTGRDRPVQDYVLEQEAATTFLKCLVHMMDGLLPSLEEKGISEFSIAFGCTGGQHRSATMVEALASELQGRYPHVTVRTAHRELDKPLEPSDQKLAKATAEQLKAET